MAEMDLATALADRELLRDERDTYLKEAKELRAALVSMCDTYSSNRSEKLRVKAVRFVAAKGAGPFSLAAVEAELAKIEERERDELERCREALAEALEGWRENLGRAARVISDKHDLQEEARIAELRKKHLG